jgi:hypothetical protein
MVQKNKINFIGVEYVTAEYVTAEFITVNPYKRHRMNSITFRDAEYSDQSCSVFLLVWNTSTGFRPLVRSSRERLVWRQLTILHPPCHSFFIPPSFHLRLNSTSVFHEFRLSDCLQKICSTKTTSVQIVPATVIV